VFCRGSTQLLDRGVSKDLLDAAPSHRGGCRTFPSPQENCALHSSKVVPHTPFWPNVTKNMLFAHGYPAAKKGGRNADRVCQLGFSLFLRSLRDFSSAIFWFSLPAVLDFSFAAIILQLFQRNMRHPGGGPHHSPS
jgi:hypothetical protein